MSLGISGLLLCGVSMWVLTGGFILKDWSDPDKRHGYQWDSAWAPQPDTLAESSFLRHWTNLRKRWGRHSRGLSLWPKSVQGVGQCLPHVQKVSHVDCLEKESFGTLRSHFNPEKNGFEQSWASVVQMRSNCVWALSAPKQAGMDRFDVKLLYST